MVEFTFNGTKMLVDQQMLAGPKEVAFFLWKLMTSQEEFMPLDVACRLAPYDREVWDELRKYVTDNPSVIAAQSQADLATLCSALATPPPRKGKGTTHRRDSRLWAIACILKSDNPGIGFTPRVDGSGIADILTTLPNCAMEPKAMHNLLLKHSRSHNF